MTNPEVYPITADFEKKVQELVLVELGKPIADRMIAHLKEYEHGVAEPEVLFPANMLAALKAYGYTNDVDDTPTEYGPKTLQELALETMSNMFFDYLLTYWVNHSEKTEEDT